MYLENIVLKHIRNNDSLTSVINDVHIMHLYAQQNADGCFGINVQHVYRKKFLPKECNYGKYEHKAFFSSPRFTGMQKIPSSLLLLLFLLLFTKRVQVC